MSIEDTDMEGETVRAGDRIAFSFGIPPRRVEGVLFEREGKLIMPTPDVIPREATLNQLRHHVGGFWKVSKTQKEALRAIFEADQEPADDRGICPDCQGSGEAAPDQICQTCNGSGAEQ